MTNVSNFATCISFNNQPLMTRPNLIDSNPDEYNQGLRYYAFTVKLDAMKDVILSFIHPVEYV